MQLWYFYILYTYRPWTYAYCIHTAPVLKHIVFILTFYLHILYYALIQPLYLHILYHTGLVHTQYTYCIHTALVCIHILISYSSCTYTIYILYSHSPCTYTYWFHTALVLTHTTNIQPLHLQVWTSYMDIGHMLYRSFLLHKYNPFNTHTAYIQSFYIHALTYDINIPLACTFWMMLKALSHMHFRHKYRPISHTSAYTQAFHLPRL